jgi:hypothetical protein
MAFHKKKLVSLVPNPSLLWAVYDNGEGTINVRKVPSCNWITNGTNIVFIKVPFMAVMQDTSRDSTQEIFYEPAYYSNEVESSELCPEYDGDFITYIEGDLPTEFERYKREHFSLTECIAIAKSRHTRRENALNI